MGLYNIKTEMEDLAMKYMEPDTYRYIAQKLQDTKGNVPAISTTSSGH